jgi:hypothetical protein
MTTILTICCHKHCQHCLSLPSTTCAPLDSFVQHNPNIIIKSQTDLVFLLCSFLEQSISDGDTSHSVLCCSCTHCKRSTPPHAKQEVPWARAESDSFICKAQNELTMGKTDYIVQTQKSINQRRYSTRPTSALMFCVPTRNSML